MTESIPLIEPKTNRSRTEVGRLAVGLIQSHELVRATSGDEYDVQFFASEHSPNDGLRPVLESKTNRSRAEIGRAIFDVLNAHDEVWVGSANSEYDIQMYTNE